MNTFWKAMATLMVWLLGGGIITVMSIFLGETLGGDILYGIILVVFGMMMSSGFIWNWGRDSASVRMQDKAYIADQIDSAINSRQKRKNSDISRRLRDYSDDELIALRERVASGEISESELAQLLG
ncbi:MAG: hypothetical protein AAFV93_14950 [Chloroflexota bacterium]